MTHREHGTHVKYVIDRCRCDDCRTATAAYEAHRSRQRAYGIDAYIDATPARTHVRRLGAQGMGWKRVARTAGLSPSTVWKLLYGDPSRNRVPNKRIRPATANTILAVTLDLADGQIIDGTGTTRRIQALVAIGWSQSSIARRVGIHPANLTPLAHGRRSVHVGTARAVIDLYDELCMTPAPTGNRHSNTSRTRALNYAAAHDWAPPLAWDEDTIDDPAATPAVEHANEDPDVDEVAIQRRMGGDRTIRLTKAEKYELVACWQNTGRSLNELERVTGLNRRRYLPEPA